MNPFKIALVLAVGGLCASCSKSLDENAATSATTSERKSTQEQELVPERNDREKALSSSTIIESGIPATIVGFDFILGGKCGVDQINKAGRIEVTSIRRSEGLVVDGWALDDQLGTVPSAVVLQLVNGDRRYYASLNRHSGREDLVKEFGKPAFENAGYGASINIGDLPSAQYEMLVIQKSENRNLVCPTYRKLVVKD